MPSRQLPIERERDLVHMFAFLSTTRDDPKRVMAVGLEEHVQKKAMIIRVAANRGDLSSVGVVSNPDQNRVYRPMCFANRARDRKVEIW